MAEFKLAHPEYREGEETPQPEKSKSFDDRSHKTDDEKEISKAKLWTTLKIKWNKWNKSRE